MPLASYAFLALGSNLGDSLLILCRAIQALSEFSEDPLLVSSFWKTQPVDCPPGSPKFINAVVGLRPRQGETPESLLKKLQAMERCFGRQPAAQPNTPRLLDLDLIAFGGEIRRTPDLILPHPRAHGRRFVLQPLAEIAPDFVLPGHHCTVRQLLEDLPGAQDVRRLPRNDG